MFCLERDASARFADPTAGSIDTGSVRVVVCRKTGTLPQIRRCRAGTVIERTLSRITIPRQINGFRDFGAFRALASMVLFLSMRRLPWVEYKPRMGYRICDGSLGGETRTLSLRSRLGFRAKSKPSRRLGTG